MTVHFKVDLEEKFEVHELPIQEVLYLNKENDLLIDVPIHEGSVYINRTMSNLCAEQEDVNLLFIQRANEKIRKNRHHTKLQVGDILYVYGDKKLLMDTFEKEIASKKSLVKDEKKTTSLL